MCGIAGLMNRQGRRENGERIKRAIVLQNDRGNGLGAGFAVYGAYPQFKNCFALHLMATDKQGLKEAREKLEHDFTIVKCQDIPVWDKQINDHPHFQLCFVAMPEEQTSGVALENVDEEAYTLEKVVEVNSQISGVFIYGSGKNIGIFKGVGLPEDIYNFFQLDNYEGYLWLAHNRFPTNTPGWWGGAHPFNMLNCSIVHNGEISSYGINKRYLESFGYACNMQTDSEVVAYLLDLLVRKHGLTIEEAITVMAPPYWSSVERMEDGEKKNRLLALKMVYEGAMLNGPFAILAAYHHGIFTLTDNTKLRPMTVGYRDDYVYFASEVSALYEMEDNLNQVFTPRAGEPCLVNLTEDNFLHDYSHTH